MAIVASDSGGGNFTPHPEGSFPMSCVDVYDAGMVETQWGEKRKVDVYFWGGKWDEKEYEGEKRRFPLLVRQRFTLSLDERGRLRPFLESWRGQRFTSEELRGFDLERLIGKPAYIQVTHNAATNGNVYANITGIMRLPEEMKAPGIPADFIRKQDRPPREGSGSGQRSSAPQTQQRQQSAPAPARSGGGSGYDDFKAPPMNEGPAPWEPGDDPNSDGLPF